MAAALLKSIGNVLLLLNMLKITSNLDVELIKLSVFTV